MISLGQQHRPHLSIVDMHLCVCVLKEWLYIFKSLYIICTHTITIEMYYNSCYSDLQGTSLKGLLSRPLHGSAMASQGFLVHRRLYHYHRPISGPCCYASHATAAWWKGARVPQLEPPSCEGLKQEIPKFYLHQKHGKDVKVGWVAHFHLQNDQKPEV